MIDYEKRDLFLKAVEQQLEPNIFKHSLAVEACMNGVYDYLNKLGQIGAEEPKKEDWLLAGLIHDIDYSGEFKEDHPNKTKEACKKYGLEITDIVHDIVKAHDGRWHKGNLSLKAHWAIFCIDSLTGLIVATALVYPSKKLQDVKVSSISKRFYKEPRFAAGTRRDEVAMCAKEDGLNIPVEKFFEICLASMQGISDELGL